jgi:hypothetical protein
MNNKKYSKYVNSFNRDPKRVNFILGFKISKFRDLLGFFGNPNTKILNPKLKIIRFGSRFNEFTSFVGWPLTNLVASRNNLEFSMKNNVKLQKNISYYIIIFERIIWRKKFMHNNK